MLYRNWTVEIDQELEHLFPDFIENRWVDLDTICEAARVRDFEALEKIGHNLLGPTGAFGIDFLVQLSRELQFAAQKRNIEAIHTIADNFEEFLRTHRIVVKGKDHQANAQNTVH